MKVIHDWLRDICCDWLMDLFLGPIWLIAMVTVCLWIHVYCLAVIVALRAASNWFCATSFILYQTMNHFTNYKYNLCIGPVPVNEMETAFFESRLHFLVQIVAQCSETIEKSICRFFMIFIYWVINGFVNYFQMFLADQIWK